MKSRVIRSRGVRIFAVVFDEGDEVAAGLLRFAEEKGLTAAEFTGIGAFSRATLGFFEFDRKEYHPIEVDEQVEVLTLAGNVALHEGKPKVHAHVVLGRRDGTAVGGHLLEAHVRPTLEVMVTESPADLHRRIDAGTGLPLIQGS